MSSQGWTLRGFLVLSLERPEGERFAIFRQDDWLRAASPSQWGSPAAHIAAMERFVQSLELMTEESLRSRLQELGVIDEAADDHIAHARKIRDFNWGVSWESVTAPGYRNEEGQVVVARTERTGSDPAQRVFLMRCSVCGHEYGTHGADIPHRCCPSCQEGAPGLPV